MTMKRMVLAAVLLAAQTGGASAKFINGNNLLEACRMGDKQTVNAFLAGAHDAYATAEEIGHSIMRVCLPKGVTLNHLEEVSCSFLEQNPESRHQNASSLVWVVMTETWPCR